MKYRNDDDKCYGVAGMTLGLSIFDAADLFTGVSVDDDEMGIVFTPEFYFMGNPGWNAKESWQHMLSHFQISMGLVMANALCRKIVLDHGTVDRKLRNSLFNAIYADGKEGLQLDKDEVESLFDRYFSHLMRVFSNEDICKAMRHLAGELKAHRAFSRVEINDMLQDLSII